MAHKNGHRRDFRFCRARYEEGDLFENVLVVAGKN